MRQVHYPSRHFRPGWRSAAGGSPAFLMQLPCSWGAMFFRTAWRRFVRFYRIRGAPPFYNASEEAMQKGQRAQREVLRCLHSAQAWPARLRTFRGAALGCRAVHAAT